MRGGEGAGSGAPRFNIGRLLVGLGRVGGKGEGRVACSSRARK